MSFEDVQEGLRCRRGAGSTADGAPEEEVQQLRADTVRAISSARAGLEIALGALDGHCAALEQLAAGCAPAAGRSAAELEAQQRRRRLCDEEATATVAVKEAHDLLAELRSLLVRLPAGHRALLEDQLQPSFAKYGEALERFARACELIAGTTGGRARTVMSAVSGGGGDTEAQQEGGAPLAVSIQEQREADEGMRQLESELHDLKELFDVLHANVKSSAYHVDSIERNIDDARSHVNEGAKDLSRAASLQVAMYPLMGAALGACIGGPVGAAVGLKGIGLVGGICAGLGVGAFSGQRLKSVRQSQIDRDAAMLESKSWAE